jgi:hypothetical protein
MINAFLEHAMIQGWEKENKQTAEASREMGKFSSVKLKGFQ